MYATTYRKTDGIDIAPAAGYLGGLGRTVVRAAGTLLLWQRRAAERQRLIDLDDRLLTDMGFTYADAQREHEKPFWRA